MGDYSINCGLTGMWLKRGDPCYVLLLKRTALDAKWSKECLDKNSTGEPTDFYRPIALPFEAIYDESHRFEEIKRDATVEAVERLFKMSIEDIVESHKGLKEQGCYSEESVHLHTMVMHKDIYDKVVSLMREDGLRFKRDIEKSAKVLSKSREEVLEQMEAEESIYLQCSKDGETMKDVFINMYVKDIIDRNTPICRVFGVNNRIVELYSGVDEQYFRSRFEELCCIEDFLGYTGKCFMRNGLGNYYAEGSRIEFLIELMNEQLEKDKRQREKEELGEV